MPNRIIREGILSSDRIEMLDFAAEVFYRRLMSKVDDHGLFDARPSMLRTSLYPLRVDRVREADIARWIAACEMAGVIALYVHGGKPYGQMVDTRWQARSEPKFPRPPWGEGAPLPAAANSCAQPPAAATVFGDEGEAGNEYGGGDEKAPARKRAAQFDAAQIDLPDWLAREDWARWCADRKERKKPITLDGAALQITKLAKYREEGSEPKDVIENSIANGYQGLFAPARNRSQPQTAASQMGESAAKALRVAKHLGLDVRPAADFIDMETTP
jgi:hypothetical protein